VCVIENGSVREDLLAPEDAGLERASNDALIGGDAVKNRDILLSVFEGARGPVRDVVIFNAAAALVSTGGARSYREGAAMAAEVIDTGRARACLKNVLDFAKSLERDGAA
jgi:anthranilate phosphoribosyltransferase